MLRAPFITIPSLFDSLKLSANARAQTTHLDDSRGAALLLHIKGLSQEQVSREVDEALEFELL